MLHDYHDAKKPMVIVRGEEGEEEEMLHYRLTCPKNSAA